MPLTKLDEACALIVIDLQKGIVGMQAAHASDEIVARAARLASGFRGAKLPVVLVNVAGMEHRAEQMRARRRLRVRATGQSWFPNSTSSMATISLRSSASGLSSAHRYMTTCARNA